MYKINYADVCAVVSAIRNGRISISEMDSAIIDDYWLNNHSALGNLINLVASGYDFMRDKFFVVLSYQDYKYPSDDILYLPVRYFTDIETYYKYIHGQIYTNSCFFKYQFPPSFVSRHHIKLELINFKSINKYTYTKLIDDTAETIIDNLHQSQIQDDRVYIKSFRKRYKLLSNLKNYYGYPSFKRLLAKNDQIVSLYLTEIVKSLMNTDDEWTKYYAVLYLLEPTCHFDRWLEALARVIDQDELNQYVDLLTDQRAVLKLKVKDKELLQKKVGSFKDEKDFSIILKERVNSLYFQFEKEKQDKLDKAVRLAGDPRARHYQNDALLEKGIYVKVIPSFTNNKEINQPFAVYFDFYYQDKIFTRYVSRFAFFFDFYFFLKEDINWADLSSMPRFELLNARMPKPKPIDKKNVTLKAISLNESSENESLPAMVEREPEKISETSLDDFRVYYISDLHLEHRFYHYGAKTSDQIKDCLNTICEHLEKSIAPSSQHNFIIIDGDVCHDMNLFNDFVSSICKPKDISSSLHNHYVFTLGNHELWDNQGMYLDSLINKYKDIVESNYATILNNSILYYDLSLHPYQINERDLEWMSDEQLENTLENAKLIFFGGTGYAGRNERFNANEGIYQDTINREEEIKLSKDFSDLYDKVVRCTPNRKVIIVSHMPFSDWSDKDYHENYIYISGHTHKNVYYLTDQVQVYSDNQIGYSGYKTTYPHYKYFYISSSLDLFESYKDGIYPISESDYINFLRGKGVNTNVSRDFYKLFMLKRDGYYMFVSQNRTNELAILNGGHSKKLVSNDINYYFNNMDKVIRSLESSLFAYFDTEKNIAKEVISMGGSGTIHGCIIDIDFYNHIYLNPIDGTITAYNAPDMNSRTVYSSVSYLLEKECPKLYSSYFKSHESGLYPIISENDAHSHRKTQKIDYGTYIYDSSREINKMQKIDKNILTTWPDSFEPTQDNQIETKSIRQIGQKKK